MIADEIGDEWTVHLEQLAELKPLIKDAGFVRAVRVSKEENKNKCADMLTKDYGVKINRSPMFDIQMKGSASTSGRC